MGLPAEVAAASKAAATRGVLRSVCDLLEDGATHVGVACDTVIESFRNDLWPGYKSSAGMPRELLAQFPLVELAMEVAGFTVWPQVAYEAAGMTEADPEVVSALDPDYDGIACEEAM